MLAGFAMMLIYGNLAYKASVWRVLWLEERVGSSGLMMITMRSNPAFTSRASLIPLANIQAVMRIPNCEATETNESKKSLGNPRKSRVVRKMPTVS